jgi:tetratricopeptide (TPR) repeat protein/predicted aspartyl protease
MRLVKLLTRKLVSLCAPICAALLPCLSHAECKRAALELPVTISGTRPIIGAKVNGKEARFLVDSGAFFSMISDAAAAEYQLKIGSAPFGLTISGIGGSTIPGLATVKIFTVANIDIPHVEFLTGGSDSGDGTIGLLGQNFLQHWNVEYDLARGMIRLFRDNDCNGKFLAYWVVKDDLPYTETRIEKTTPLAPHTVAHGYINGQKIRVMFDSGAFASMLSLKAAKRAGVNVDSPGVVDGGVTYGIGRSLVKSYIAPFSSFKFEDGEEIKNARLRVADVNLETADMLIGGDFFLSHRIFVANNQNKMYFTYNGGAVFDLRKMDAAQAATAATADAKPAEEGRPEAEEGENAAALARRASASIGRHDYDAALTDLSRAVELEPNNSEYFHERGRVLWSKKDTTRAAADFDRAIQLKPDYVPALLDRAELRIGAKNLAEARADLDAIDKIAAKQADVRYDLGFAYEHANQPTASLAQFDLWIASHGYDARRFYAMGGRCRVRSLLGQDLPAALKDCNDALAHGDGKDNASMLDNRALVRLRLGDYNKAIIDYDASLKAEPNWAWTLYGRGIAKLKSNQRAAGEADIAAAIKIAPKIAERYKEIGLTQD